MGYFAATLGDLGQVDEAAALLEVAEEKRRGVLGDRHPYTKVVARNLARLSARMTAQNAEISHRKDRKKGHSSILELKGKYGKGKTQNSYVTTDS